MNHSPISLLYKELINNPFNRYIPNVQMRKSSNEKSPLRGFLGF